jgi:ATP/ADP translocase
MGRIRRETATVRTYDASGTMLTETRALFAAANTAFDRYVNAIDEGYGVAVAGVTLQVGGQIVKRHGITPEGQP